MKRNAGWMLLAALCVLLCACRAQRSAVPAAAAGRYSGESVCIYGGERTPMDEVYSGESYLELREDGRGTASCPRCRGGVVGPGYAVGTGRGGVAHSTGIGWRRIGGIMRKRLGAQRR